jgi:membrane-associated phospholipid phosphatase
MTVIRIRRRTLGLVLLLLFPLMIMQSQRARSGNDAADDDLIKEKRDSSENVWNGYRGITTAPVWSDMFVNIPRDWIRWTSIAFQPEYLPEWIAVGGSTIALIASDAPTYDVSKRWYDSDTHIASASRFFEALGNGSTQFGLSGAFAVYGLLADDDKALRVASQIFETVLASGTVVQVLKHSTGRESPFVATSPTGRWRVFPSPLKYHEKIPSYDAYPSGHVATSLATVIVLAENYPDVTWIRPVGYMLVAGVAVGMVNYGTHWYSDYPLSVLLGYTFGMLAAHPEALSKQRE